MVQQLEQLWVAGAVVVAEDQPGQLRMRNRYEREMKCRSGEK
jgi:hypothetical protein